MNEIYFEKKLHTTDGFINLEIGIKIEKNSFVSLSGRSGSGKTTFLKILAGLVAPEKGKITINDTVLFSSSEKINVPPQERKVGFVFQDFALFPNFTVFKNLLYVNNDKERINELLEIMDLKELSDRYPEKLSGGQNSALLWHALRKKS